MALTLARNLESDGGSVYYSDAWQLMIETHLLFLMSRPDNSVITVAPSAAWRWRGNLTGLLVELQIRPQLRWAVMRMNGMRSVYEYRHEMQRLIVPSSTVIEQLTRVHQTTMAKIK